MMFFLLVCSITLAFPAAIEVRFPFAFLFTPLWSDHGPVFSDPEPYARVVLPFFYWLECSFGVDFFAFYRALGSFCPLHARPGSF